MSGKAKDERPDPVFKPALGPVAAALPADEAQRLAALRETAVLDTAPEATYDDLTALASHLCGTPIALISLVDADRQWFKSRVGLGAEETPRELAFCAHALLDPHQIFEVADATADARFAGNPLVTSNPNIRFYAGAPLLSAEGLPLGTLCVIDRKPRQLDEYQRASLRTIGRLASEMLRNRRSNALGVEIQARFRAELKQEVAERDAKLVESEARYRELADESPAMINRSRNEPGWPTLYVSQAVERITGYPASAFTDDPSLWGSLMLAEDVPEISHAVAAQQAQGLDVHVQYRIRHKDGSIRWIEGNARLKTLTDGSEVYEGVNIDITARKEAELALAERTTALERATIATHAARIAPFTWHVDRDFFETDAQAEVLLGLEPGEATGTLASYCTRVHPDDRDNLASEIARLLASGRPEFALEYRTVSAQGRVRWIRSVGRIAVIDGTQHVTGALSDATMELEVQRALEDRTREMERAITELDEFTYIASHDLKEPLRGIHNYARFIAEDYADKLDPAGQNMLKAVSEQADRMQRLIEDLLEIARLGREPMQRTETDLDKLLDDVLASLSFSLTEKKVSLRKLPLGTFICDRVRVAEVFRNLVTNALKYNDKPVPEIEIGSRASATGETEFYVRDNGIGIKPDFHARVFAPFKRLHAKDAYGGGTGVGLAIVKRIVEAHGGSIGVTSESGAGATFFFTLSGEHFS